MREVYFRGFNGSEWIYGDLITDYKSSTIVTDGRCNGSHVYVKRGQNVSPESIGQKIGLKDKDGTDIYSGDLVEYDSESNGAWEQYQASEVVYDETYAIYCFKDDAPNLFDYYKNLKVIGNIYENPELV